MPWTNTSGYSLWRKSAEWSWRKHKAASSPGCSEHLAIIQFCSRLLHMPSFLFFFFLVYFPHLKLSFYYLKSSMSLFDNSLHLIFNVYIIFNIGSINCKNIESSNSFNVFHFATKLFILLPLLIPALKKLVLISVQESKGPMTLQDPSRFSKSPAV